MKLRIINNNNNNNNKDKNTIYKRRENIYYRESMNHESCLHMLGGKLITGNYQKGKA